MNRIVREHYPVSKLPEDLREGLEEGVEVRVTIDLPEENSAAGPQATVPRSESFSERYKHLRRANFATMEDVVAHVRALRDD